MATSSIYGCLSLGSYSSSLLEIICTIICSLVFGTHRAVHSFPDLIRNAGKNMNWCPDTLENLANGLLEVSSTIFFTLFPVLIRDFTLIVGHYKNAYLFFINSGIPKQGADTSFFLHTQ